MRFHRGEWHTRDAFHTPEPGKIPLYKPLALQAPFSWLPHSRPLAPPQPCLRSTHVELNHSVALDDPLLTSARPARSLLNWTSS